MREQLKEMEVELLQYHKSNAALDLMIGELKLKKEGMMKDSDEVGRQLSDAVAHRERITADVHAALKPSNGREFKVGGATGLSCAGMFGPLCEAVVCSSFAMFIRTVGPFYGMPLGSKLGR